MSILALLSKKMQKSLKTPDLRVKLFYLLTHINNFVIIIML
jgi:hypothetical protein